MLHQLCSKYPNQPARGNYKKEVVGNITIPVCMQQPNYWFWGWSGWCLLVQSADHCWSTCVGLHANSCILGLNWFFLSTRRYIFILHQTSRRLLPYDDKWLRSTSYTSYHKYVAASSQESLLATSRCISRSATPTSRTYEVPLEMATCVQNSEQS